MPELSPECDELRVVREGVDLGFEPPRPPGPSKGRLAYSYPAPPAPPKPPFQAKTFIVDYPFEGMVNFQSPRSMGPALTYAQLTHAKRVEITGYRGATQLSDGKILEEHQGIARERADEIAEMLRGAGVDKAEMIVSAVEAPTVGGPDIRRVEIKIVP